MAPWRRALAFLGVAGLCAAALAGVLFSGGFLLLSTELGRSLLVPRLLAVANGQIAGKLELDGFSVGAAGGLEIRGLRILDPRGQQVLEVRRASGQVDLSRLRSRRVSLRLSIEGLDLALARLAGEPWNLEAALARRVPTPPTPSGPLTWTIRLARLDLQGGTVSVRDGSGPELRLRELGIAARAILSPRGGRGELSLRAAMALPEERAVSLDLAARSDAGDRISVPHLRLALGETVIDLAAEGSVAARSGRLAIVAASLRPEDLRLLAERVSLAPLTASGYAESDGQVASAALSLRPAAGGGSGDLAVATQLPQAAPRPPAAAQAIGLDLRLDRLDPSRVSPLLPPGDIRLTAKGHASGTDLATLRAALELTGDRSRLRTGSFGPLALRARAEGGTFELKRLDAALPGATLAARGTWRPQGAVSGSLVANAPDLGALARNLSALTGATLPRLAGQGRIEGSLAGTAQEPDAKVKFQAPRLQVEDAVATGAALDAGLSGPAANRQARLDATVARLTAPGIEARSLTARARLAGPSVEWQLSALLPEVGEEPFAFRGRGDLSEDRARFTLAELALSWPGTRFELAAPARIELAGPRVDRLGLRAGPQRLTLSGGLDGGRLDAVLSAEALELGRIPSALLPAGLGLAGSLSFSARAQGKPEAPLLTAHVELANGSARGLTGLGAVADARVDLAARRAAGTLALGGLAGGRADLAADLPLPPLRARAGEAMWPAASPISLAASAEGLDVAALLRAAGLPEELRGRLSGKVAAGGTAGSPSLRADVALAEGAYAAYGPIALQVTAEERAGRIAATLALDHAGARALSGEGSVALDLAALLRDPARVAAGLRRAPFEARGAVPGLELATLSGRGHLPAALAGRLTASLSARGTSAAPRGELQAEVVELAHAGYAGIGVTATGRAEDGATSLALTATGGGEQLLSAEVRLGQALERLLDPAALRAAPLEGKVEAGASDLSRLRAPAGLAGSATLTARLGGKVGAPELDARAGAQRLSVSGRAVGDLTATLRAAREELAAQASVTAAAGGRLEAGLDARVAVSLDTLESGSWREAPARAHLKADGLDLAVLASGAPGTFRSASGRLDADLQAEGPLGRLRPTGTFRVASGNVNVVGAGEWHDIELAASLTSDAARLERLFARRGRGSLEGSGAVTGIGGAAPARLEARLVTRQLLLSSAGQDLATLDLDAQLTGTATPEALRVEVTVLDGKAVLPGRSPRPLQSLEARKDVVVGRPEPAARLPAGAGLRAEVHLLVPGRFKVRSLVPAVDLTLRGDTTFTLAEGSVTADGRMEAVEGSIETYGRLFKVRRAVVVFVGGPPTEGAIDAEALWTENPAARVTISVVGPLLEPVVKMTSDPTLDEGTIALLIATGRTEAKAGTGGVSSITGEQAGSAVLGALATKALRDVLQDKLPIDVVPESATQIRAGVYLSDTVYVGYTRRLDANPEQGQNANEGRFEWQFRPRWSLETRYGDANTGSASVVWSKDY